MRIFRKDPGEMAIIAKDSPAAREKLINKYEQDILRIASSACSKYVSKSDDEWSVALCAFSKAIDNYEKERGEFMGFASTLIKRDLIDYYRHESLHSPELPVSPTTFEGNAEEETAVAYAIGKSIMEEKDSTPADEISALTEVLDEFGFSFMDLAEGSPKQERTRRECLKASSFLANEKELYRGFMRDHKLPSAVISQKTGVSVKTLDRYRKYIIASAIILSDEYPYLAGYLKPLERREQT